ncbi:hypothetical protein [Pararhodobacter oceanensis]|uniref:hypothetical protein n=1 Tax=Pararhodobacter oceanensis TaxID=2172121 RepID=UPI00197E231A|nr:hypothetical protein [Pararhodobacter oceanensis]
MRQVFVIAGFSLMLALPLAAQEAPEGGRFGEMMGELLERIDPFMGSLAELLGDYSGWHMPELLPNGDILIRRREAPPPEAEEAEPPVLDPLEL